MPRFLSTLAPRIGLAAAVVLMLAIGFLPLFGGPGYESAFAAGLVVPLCVALATALEVARARAEPFEAFCRGVANGGLYAAAVWLTTLFHGLRDGFCDFLGGSTLFALGPACGALLAGAWGALAGEIGGSIERPVRRRLATLALAMAGPIGSALVSLVRFYTSPMVFAYDPFVGYFSGTLYDTIIDHGGLLAYRAGSAATLFAAFVAAMHLVRDDRGRLHFHSIGRPGLLVAGGVALTASLTSIFLGNRLGHWQTSQSIAAELGAVIEGQRCQVVYARGLRLADAQRFARDCDAHVAAGEAWLGISGTPKIRAYLFADAAQKDALMGAADTYIAKPWRHEVYLQQGGYPHPARGPFGTAGSWGGLIPDPGLIEGVAVAASPREGDLSAAEWAKAMKDLGILPPLSRLFALGFLGESSSTAYTVSGAFVGWVHEQFGAAVVREWYGGRDLPAVTGKSWADLEGAWLAALDAIIVEPAAAATARAKFDRPGVFGRRCPHVVDACKREARRLENGGDWTGARDVWTQARALDPGDGLLRVASAQTLVREGLGESAVRELTTIAADEAVPRHVRDKALEELGDQALAAGDGETAVARYREVATRQVEEDPLRTLDVKSSVAADATARAAVVALLIGDGSRPPDKVRAAELLGAWAVRRPSDGLPEYLLGRHWLGAGDWPEAAAHLDRALARELPLPRVLVEAERLRVITACALGDAVTADRVLATWGARGGVPASRKEALRDLVTRCTGRAPAP
ncbi:MAG: hypothetical protein WKG00_26670 [Polyangiaceae bacterium]